MHYKNEPSESELELESEESIVERTKLRRQRFAEQPNEQLDTTVMPDLESEESALSKKKT